MNNISVQYDTRRFTQSQNQAIREALEMAAKAHAGQLRASGEPYLVHPVAVAEIVVGWDLGHEAVMAALLHDVVEDTDITLDQLSEQFGPKVAELVDGVTKLRLSTSPRLAEDSPRREVSSENLRKLLLATAKDYRVILIKLADRLHNLRTLKYLEAGKRVRIARESLDVYAPLADRLGMGQLKVELDDLGFRYAYPEEYADVERRVRLTTDKAERYLAVLKRAMLEYLADGEVEVQRIESRPKHYYSVYKKLNKAGGDLDKIYDLMAVRVIVPDVAACYQALGVLHHHYRPLIYRIKDYIAVPKPNGYQSLHTTVFAEDGHITEIQIRTQQMHEAAEYGLAAHFYYAEQKTSGGDGVGQVMPRSLEWVQGLQRLKQSTGGGPEFVEGARLDLFTDRIFVFSPKGDLYDLPEGATALDFAFAVHTDVGLRALGAKVNGRMVPLAGRLENRDVVEVVTRREAAPSRDWLGVVVTSQAKSRIRSWFRAASRESNVALGRSVLETELRAWGVKLLEDLPKAAVAGALDVMHVRSLDDLLEQVGEGSIGTAQVIRRLIPNAAKPQGATVVRHKEPTGRVLIEGEQLSYVLAACCNPVWPQPLLGYVTRGKGVTVHALGCRNLPSDHERYVTCRWEMVEDAEFVVCGVELEAASYPGLLSDITGAVARRRINIRNITSERLEDGEQTRIRFGVEIPDLFVLVELIRELERLPGVKWAQRAS